MAFGEDYIPIDPQAQAQADAAQAQYAANTLYTRAIQQYGASPAEAAAVAQAYLQGFSGPTAAPSGSAENPYVQTQAQAAQAAAADAGRNMPWFQNWAHDANGESLREYGRGLAMMAPAAFAAYGAAAGSGSAAASDATATGAAADSGSGYVASSADKAAMYGGSGYGEAAAGASGGTGIAGTAAAPAAGTVAPAAGAAAPATTPAASPWFEGKGGQALSMLAGQYLSSQAQRQAANSAAGAQSSAAQAGISEQQRQFDATRQLLSPYVQTGATALGGQADIAGANGAPAQQAAIAGIQSSPLFTALQRQGENSILANASATGGLRGGNTQAALAQFSPQLLSQLIDQQYSRLGGLSSLGQNSAVMTGNAGQNTGNAISNLLQQQGAATAGAALAGGRATGQLINGAMQAGGYYLGNNSGGFGATAAPQSATFGQAPPAARF